MKIKDKVFFSLIGMFALLLIVIIATYQASQTVDYYRKRTVLLEHQLVAMTSLRAQVRNLVLETYEVSFVEDLKVHHVDIERIKAEIQKNFEIFEIEITNETRSDFIEITRSEYRKLEKSLTHVTDLISENKIEDAKAALLLARVDDFDEGFIKKTTMFLDEQKDITFKNSRALELSILHLQHILILSSIVALVLVAALMLLVFRSLGHRLQQLELATRKIAAGDFNIRLDEKGSDEASALSQAFNQMGFALLEARDKLTKQQEMITYSSKMSALGQMAGGIAHEINTPLAAMILNAEMIEMKNSEFETPDKEIEKRSKAIGEIGNRIAKIILGLKGFSRDAQNDEKEKFTMRKLISMTTELCNEKFKNHGVKIYIDETMLDIEIEGQIIQLSQTLLNLMNNSYDAIQDMDDKWIELKIRTTDANLEIVITDSGRGIPEHIINKIFDPFFTTKDIGKGTGLGLSVSKGIIKQHGGNIFYDPTANNTCFVIQLPITKKENSL